ncbi:MAG: HTH domain-containing protein [Amylibacter sp.]
MPRSSRMFEIIQALRSAANPVTAAQIAMELEVTPRTIYRDIATCNPCAPPPKAPLASATSCAKAMICHR